MSTSAPETWQPPSNFSPVASKLPGVTVYAPAPKVETGPEALTFKCPRCGATTAYDPAAASVTCASCGKEAKVPFIPRGDKPVYCDDCFHQQRRSSRW